MSTAGMCDREVVAEEDMEMEASRVTVMVAGPVEKVVILQENVPKIKEEAGMHVAVEEEMEVAVMEEVEEPVGAEVDSTIWSQVERLVEQDSSRKQQQEVREQESKPSRVFRQLHPLRGGRWSR